MINFKLNPLICCKGDDSSSGGSGGMFGGGARGSYANVKATNDANTALGSSEQNSALPANPNDQYLSGEEGNFENDFTGAWSQKDKDASFAEAKKVKDSGKDYGNGSLTSRINTDQNISKVLRGAGRSAIGIGASMLAPTPITPVIAKGVANKYLPDKTWEQSGESVLSQDRGSPSDNANQQNNPSGEGDMMQQNPEIAQSQPQQAQGVNPEQALETLKKSGTSAIFNFPEGSPERTQAVEAFAAENNMPVETVNQMVNEMMGGLLSPQIKTNVRGLLANKYR